MPLICFALALLVALVNIVAGPLGWIPLAVALGLLIFGLDGLQEQHERRTRAARRDRRRRGYIA